MISKKLFFNNIYELKLRLYYSTLTFILTFITCFFFFQNILFKLVNPIFNYMNSPRFLFNNLVDVFYINIKIALFISAICLIFLLIIHLSLFLWNGLYKNEQQLFKKLYVNNFMGLTIMITIIYYFLVPFIWQYFLYFENNFLFPLHFEAQIKNYIDFLLNILLNSFLIFESLFFIFCYFFLFKNKFNLNFLRKRKFIYTFFLLLSTLVTPPDVTSQIILSIIFIIIFEIYLYILLYYFKNLGVRQAE